MTPQLHTRRAGTRALLAIALSVASFVAVAACGGHATSGSESGPASATASGDATGATEPTPSPTPEPTAPGHAAEIPDGFPLAQGLLSDGDTTVSPPRHDVRGVVLEQSCWGRTWPGAAVDRLVVQQLGPELGVTRELAVYRDARSAAAVVAQVQAGAARCHRLPATAQQAAMDVTPEDDVIGAGHVEASFAETLTQGQPGGSVFVFSRVGRAVLAVEDSGEWTRDSAPDGAREQVRATRRVVARMCVFAHADC